ncbi:MAG: peptidase [Bacillales bacterium]|jgi:putative aminopeptidase FrvX|nr:peptidase [Bacillales bacterium]
MCVFVNKNTLELFKKITELPGAPGFEHEVRNYMKSRLAPFSDELIQDGIGSVFGVKYGKKDHLKVMVAGHMDEVGFMVTQITEQGLIRFQPLGGWWNQVLLAQRVQIITNNGPVVGVISSIPPHLLSEQLRAKPMEIKNMLIDIGADNKDDVKKIGVKPGQQIVPICEFTEMSNPNKLLAKAWDNRYGCGLAIELMEELKDDKLEPTIYVGATVQEEVGLRGAQTAANLIKPDVFFALDASPANDMSGEKNEFGKLGHGVLLRILDRTMITNSKMRDYVLDTAETHNIPYQYFVSQGGTDAGKVHLANEGVPSIVIGICSRYIHTSASIIHKDDYLAAKSLLTHLVRNIDEDIIKGLHNF